MHNLLQQKYPSTITLSFAHSQYQYLINRQMIRPLLLLALLAATLALPDNDKVSSPIGMSNVTIYSGYLDANKPGRQIHYMFIQAETNADTAPLTLWLNGGPGCSSLIGLLQQIGPYLVGNTYKLGDMLNKNEYSWNKISNLLFLESPAAVGFSSDKDKSYPWTDKETAQDAFAALKSFLFVKAPEFANRTFFISGQSYAGKYVPDLTDLILSNNMDTKLPYISIKGILVGNGVMDFTDNSLDKTEIQYMIDHQLFSNRMETIYQRACFKDFNSPRCKFFRYEFDVYIAYINQYNIYETCKDSSTQALRLKQALSARKAVLSQGMITQKQDTILGEIPDCPSDNGAIAYWNLNKIPYKTDKVNKTWQVCSDITYAISERGSMAEYKRILDNRGVKVWLFSGDWDDVVPFTDTELNVEKMRRTKVGEWSSWNVGDQHAGFYQLYANNFTVITVKGASHMVPQSTPKPMYQLFYNFVNNKGVNNQVF